MSTRPGRRREKGGPERTGAATKMDYMNLPAGPELDAVVAESVMSLVRCQMDHPAGPLRCYAPKDNPKKGSELRSYSTEIPDAWLVVERLEAELGAELTLIRIRTSNSWSAMFEATRISTQARAETAPRAIVLAALKAMELKRGSL